MYRQQEGSFMSTAYVEKTLNTDVETYSLKNVLILLIPFVIYSLHLVLLGNWIIDDAGISFAYSRNLANGYGFVSQPGRPPVEGFSNFTWVLTFIPFFWLKIFHPIFTPKLVSAFLFFASLLTIQNILKKLSGNYFIGTMLSLLLAVSPPIVIWTASGLENSLLLFAVISLWAVVLERPKHWIFWSGILAALISMTRPDGILYVLSVPSILLIETLSKKMSVLNAAQCCAKFLGSFLVLFVPFMIFRLAVVLGTMKYPWQT